jgi:O-antigen/teichoic acid export membrane protein
LGINNAILYNSDYYRLTIVLGLFLAVLTIVMNLWLIPVYGIDGAAIATVVSLFLYSVAKIVVVQWKFHMHPFTVATLKTVVLISVLGMAFFFWNFSFHPLVNILLQSGFVSGIYLTVVYKWKLSPDINGLIDKYAKK